MSIEMLRELFLNNIIPMFSPWFGFLTRGLRQFGHIQVDLSLDLAKLTFSRPNGKLSPSIQDAVRQDLACNLPWECSPVVAPARAAE